MLRRCYFTRKQGANYQLSNRHVPQSIRLVFASASSTASCSCPPVLPHLVPCPPSPGALSSLTWCPALPHLVRSWPRLPARPAPPPSHPTAARQPPQAVPLPACTQGCGNRWPWREAEQARRRRTRRRCRCRSGGHGPAARAQSRGGMSQRSHIAAPLPQEGSRAGASVPQAGRDCNGTEERTPKGVGSAQAGCIRERSARRDHTPCGPPQETSGDLPRRPPDPADLPRRPPDPADLPRRPPDPADLPRSQAWQKAGSCTTQLSHCHMAFTVPHGCRNATRHTQCHTAYTMPHGLNNARRPTQCHTAYLVC